MKGRPTKYTPELAQEICDTIASSSLGTKNLCNAKPHWPAQDTLFTWLKNHREFSEQYTQAKICQVELLVDEILTIADDTSQDTIVGEFGNVTINHLAIKRAKLRIDNRKWLASKLVPRLYNKNKAEHTDGEEY